jgi:hypothetical protein
LTVRDDGVVDVLLAVAALVPVLPLHLGALHPVEKVLTLVLAFGPFVLLAAVIVVRRRQDAAAERGGEDPRPGPQDPER